MSLTKKIAIVWATIFVLSAIVILSGASFLNSVRSRDTKAFKADKITDWRIECDGTKNADGKYTIKYTNCFGEIAKGGEYLMYFIYHADTYVYSEGELMYSMVMNGENTFFPVVSGDTWNCLFVPEEYSNKPVEVLILTDYESYLEYVPDFYFGDRSTIVRTEIADSILGLILVGLMFLVGLVVVIYSWVVKKNKGNTYDLIYLGVFSIMLAMWFLVNTRAINMLIDEGTLLTYTSYLILGFIAVPLILFEKRLLESKFKVACDVLCYFVIVMQVLVVSMQVMGIKDMKESLILTHFTVGVSIVVLITLIITDIIVVGIKKLSPMSKLNMICGVVTSTGVILDMIGYYMDANDGKNYEFTRIAFLVHVILLCLYSMRETQRLMKKGREVQKFERLAYRDELTGMYNRTALNADMKRLDINEDKYTVIMFDLNNLKKCNDSLGHNYGDNYIISSADSIRDAFIGMGNCYRIGGDEFCVIAKNVTDEEVEVCYSNMKKYISNYNTKNPKVYMSIAYGHATYDAEHDEDLKDTRGRADAIMYKNKMIMKG